MYTIAVIEDDIHIGEILETALGREGYRVVRAYSGTEALYLLEKETPDLILLDLMLPGLSGEEVLPKIKGIPVIVVSAKAGIDEKVDLLLGGAADYVTKPFELKELLARVKVQLRNKEAAFEGGTTNGVSEKLIYGELELDLYSHEAAVGGQKVMLTRTEYAILKLLMQNPNQAIAKSVILDRISLDTPDCTESSLKQHIFNLRKKLREAGESRTANRESGDGGGKARQNDEKGREYIEAVWGIGFRLRA